MKGFTTEDDFFTCCTASETSLSASSGSSLEQSGWFGVLRGLLEQASDAEGLPSATLQRHILSFFCSKGVRDSCGLEGFSNSKFASISQYLKSGKQFREKHA
jgi:hypothetical protein